ncbi:hypothetical protein BBJ29_004591 [Phytophthora kernoviae]|uniref:Uncharacterized protein n=1 Tax=Phytophthora kernoviae TaxID=325452 RepID=A0A3F2RM10_9STRA|nr:hypothetical protein BBJ29_004591 [Phytophthora kernoviae]RLN60263.1 hypothetical protein BBP00_00006097 [Phytophthora kernoviae]
MSQQAKDIYSGIKKIFPGRRSGSFSFTGRMSAAGLDEELSAEAQAVAREKPKKKEGRHSSFSFSGWKDKHRASSEPAAPVVMSLPYGATAATPKARKTSEEVEGGVQREEAAAAEFAKMTAAAHSRKDEAVVKPHASTWDSDSDDDYEDTKRPTRGLDRRSQSMDFMEQAPEHLISKIWRKLPIQARLIGGRGNVDLDLQKDRTSFSRSSEARKFAVAAAKAKAAELRRRSSSGRKVPSPVPAEEVLAPGVAKRTRFSLKLTIVSPDPNDGSPGAYTMLESYDDVLVRVCRFANHDQRPTGTKVTEFLERSMAYLHGTRTKHGNVVNISNEEIRMWRRLALHNWALEEVTTAQAATALGVKGKDVEAPSSRTSSSVTEGTDSDSDSQQSKAPRRRLQSLALSRSLSESVAEEEPEGENNEDLEVPSNTKFDTLCGVVNCCVNFGERIFTPLEVADLVRLEFIVEEDGWI